MSKQPTIIHNEKELAESVRGAFVDFIKAHGKYKAKNDDYVSPFEYEGSYYLFVFDDNAPPMSWHNEWVISVQMDEFKDYNIISFATDPCCSIWDGDFMRGLGCTRHLFDTLKLLEQVSFVQALFGTYALSETLNIQKPR